MSFFQSLQDGHAEFRASLDQAEDDIMMLRKLDRQIKSYNVSINPWVAKLFLYSFFQAKAVLKAQKQNTIFLFCPFSSIVLNPVQSLLSRKWSGFF